MLPLLVVNTQENAHKSFLRSSSVKSKKKKNSNNKARKKGTEANQTQRFDQRAGSSDWLANKITGKTD